METRDLCDVLRAQMGESLKSSVLDIGCGIGRFLAFYEESSSSLVGVDFSINMLRICQKNCPSAALVQADVSSLPLRDGSFHVVSAIVTLQHITDDTRRQEAIREMIRVAKDDGILVILDEMLESFRTRRKLCRMFGYDLQQEDHISYWPEESYLSLLAKTGLRVTRIIRFQEWCVVHYARFLLYIFFQSFYMLMRYGRVSRQYVSSSISAFIDELIMAVLPIIRLAARLIPQAKYASALIIANRKRVTT